MSPGRPSAYLTHPATPAAPVLRYPSRSWCSERLKGTPQALYNERPNALGLRRVYQLSAECRPAGHRPAAGLKRWRRRPSHSRSSERRTWRTCRRHPGRHLSYCPRSHGRDWTHRRPAGHPEPCPSWHWHRREYTPTRFPCLPCRHLPRPKGTRPAYHPAPGEGTANLDSARAWHHRI